MNIKSNLIIALAVVALLPAGAFAQGAKSANMGGFKTEADNWTSNAKTTRLVGHASVKSPQLDLNADVIGLDYEGFQITEVRARGNVKMRLDLLPKGGGPATHVETTTKSATLKVATRTLILEGNVNGFYQLPGAAKNTLSGSRAVLTYGEDKSLVADLEGGAQGVKLVLPAENPALPTAIGTVTITSQKASINSSTGTGQFSGNARAVSTDAPNKFDVSAPAFVVTRSADGAIDTLKSSGRTNLKIDFPPDSLSAPAPAPVVTPVSGAATAEKPKSEPLKQIGSPTHFEVSADSAIVQRSDNTLILQGNVSGFYELTRADGVKTKQQFSGDKAVVKFIAPEKATAEVPQGFQLEVTGKPVSIELPQFDLNF